MDKNRMKIDMGMAFEDLDKEIDETFVKIKKARKEHRLYLGYTLVFGIALFFTDKLPWYVYLLNQIGWLISFWVCLDASEKREYQRGRLNGIDTFVKIIQKNGTPADN